MNCILKNIKDEISLCNMEFPYANEILSVIIESLFNKEGSISSMIEEFLLQKGLDVFFKLLLINNIYFNLFNIEFISRI